MVYVKHRGYITASQVVKGDWIQVYDDEGKNVMRDDQVVGIDESHEDSGFIAPLTENGVILVNNVHVSCFSHAKSHYVSLIAMKPLNYFYKIAKYFNYLPFYTNLTHNREINFYTMYLYDFTRQYLPFILTEFGN